jgi:hypothetical protein
MNNISLKEFIKMSEDLANRWKNIVLNCNKLSQKENIDFSISEEILKYEAISAAIRVLSRYFIVISEGCPGAIGPSGLSRNFDSFIYNCHNTIII